MLSESGSRELVEIAEFIRADFVSNITLNYLVTEISKEFEVQGKNFDEEFKKWKENKNA